MNFFAQLIPKYLLTRRSLTIMVISAAAFAFFFIIIYKPFNVEHWAEVSQFVFVACVLGVVLLGMSIAAISRVIMCYYAKKHQISYLKYTLWVFVELVLMSVAFTICSTLTGVQLDIAEAFEKSLLNTSLILLIPYIISITAFTLQDRNSRLRQIEDDYDKAMQERATTKGLISFYDERGELQLSVTKDNLLYVESADNYIYVWYLYRLNFLHLCSESVGVQLFQRAAESQQLIYLIVVQVNIVTLRNESDLLNDLLVAHFCSLVQHHLQLIDDEGGVG